MYFFLVGLCGDFFIILNPFDEYWDDGKSQILFWSTETYYSVYMHEGKKPVPTYFVLGMSAMLVAVWMFLFPWLVWNTTTNFGRQIADGEENDNLDGPDMYQFGNVVQDVAPTSWYCPKYLTIGGFLFNFCWFWIFVFFYLYFTRWWTVPLSGLQDCGTIPEDSCDFVRGDFGLVTCSYCTSYSYGETHGCHFAGLDLHRDCDLSAFWILPMIFLIAPLIFFVVWFSISGCIRQKTVPKMSSDVEVSLQAEAVKSEESSEEHLDRSDTSQDDEMAPENSVALLPLQKSID